MIQSLRTSTPGVKQVWLADDSEGGGQIVPLYNWCNHLRQEGKKYGYLVNGSKSWPCKKNENRSLARGLERTKKRRLISEHFSVAKWY